MDLLENDDSKPMKLRINKGFATKFEAKKRREHLEKNKQNLDNKKIKGHFFFHFIILNDDSLFI